jgi:hypothetical protein
MFSRIRKRFTYANVAMTLALVFAMSGGAYAASKYVINSTKQINPKVLKALKGANGKSGAAGLAGPAGATGPGGPGGPAGAKGETGAAGAPGTKGENGAPGAKGENGTTGFTKTLPKGETEKGTWVVTPVAITGTSNIFGHGPISFGIPLSSAPTVIYLKEGEKETTECPGTVEEPKAKEGHLCVYTSVELGTTYEGAEAFTAGALLAFKGLIAGVPVYGTWAVTAPQP